MMQSINIAVRRDRETGRPVLFFVNSSAGLEWLECYDRIGQHSECHVDYMRQGCTLIRAPLPEDAAALVREWSTMGEPVNAIIRQRLTFRKG